MKLVPYLALSALLAAAPARAADRPNLVLILIDDLGYGDIGPFGSKLNRTPNLDRMAKEGMKLTSFYACPVCTPSRAQFMTGCYAKRVSLPNVLFPVAAVGLSKDEHTLPGLLKKQGYATMCVGKWHLGDQPPFLPTRHGFDHYFGLPYSNDMGPAADKPAKPDKPVRPPLPLLRDETVIETVSPEGQNKLTERYTEEAIKFLKEHKDGPFFLYLAHTAVHVPLHPGDAFRGKSKNGKYGDWVEEVDWSVGQVLDALRDLKLDDRTLVLFTSDNGGTKQASNAPLRGFKFSTLEGGMREPTIARWPGKIPAGTSCDAVTANLDVLPTFVKLAGGEVPKDRTIDGKDVWPILSGTSRESPHEAFYYFDSNRLKAVRSGPWKLDLIDGKLYNLDTDIGETTDAAADHPDVVKKLREYVEKMDADLGQQKLGPGVRKPGHVADPKPLLLNKAPAGAARRPNIVYVLADDLGYGDVKCLNPQGQIATPNMDRVAARGMAFTDAHSSCAVCTPTRYGILTGRYDWRSPLKRGVLGGYSPRLIEPDRLTVPALLKKHGYHTACVGKWHLGMDWPLKDGGIARDYPDAWKVDYARPIKNGPNAVGFDYYFGISASLDMPPYLFIENDRCQGEPTVEKTWIRKGPAHKDFEAIDVLPAITRRAVEYIAERGPKAKQGEPFFLYFALTAPHTPILPTRDWQGKSGLNAYGDFVMQVDATVGQVLDALDKAGVADDTLLMVASDNGCAPAADFPLLARKGHHPSYHFRGYKADIFDGGHHIPFLVRWPGHVKPGTICDDTVCLNDLMATCAEVVGARLPDYAGEDSASLVPVLLGTAKAPPHEAVVHHSANGSLAIRQGKWKLELCPGSGGWSDPKPGSPQEKGLPPVQLYDMTADVSERANVQDRHPEVVARLTRLLEKYVADGRSTPGQPQKNTGAVDIWNGAKPAGAPK